MQLTRKWLGMRVAAEEHAAVSAPTRRTIAAAIASLFSPRHKVALVAACKVALVAAWRATRLEDERQRAHGRERRQEDAVHQRALVRQLRQLFADEPDNGRANACVFNILNSNIVYCPK